MKHRDEIDRDEVDCDEVQRDEVHRACVRQIDVSAYIDGELSAEEADALADHLESCDVCRASLEQFHALRTEFRAIPTTPAPSRFVSATMSRLQPEGGWLAPLQRVEKYLIAAILVLGIGTAYYVTNSLRVPPSTVDVFLERSLDRETLEVTSFTGSELNNDRALGLLLSSQSP